MIIENSLLALTRLAVGVAKVGERRRDQGVVLASSELLQGLSLHGQRLVEFPYFGVRSAAAYQGPGFVRWLALLVIEPRRLLEIRQRLIDLTDSELQVTEPQPGIGLVLSPAKLVRQMNEALVDRRLLFGLVQIVQSRGHSAEHGRHVLTQGVVDRQGSRTGVAAFHPAVPFAVENAKLIPGIRFAEPILAPPGEPGRVPKLRLRFPSLLQSLQLLALGIGD